MRTTVNVDDDVAAAFDRTWQDQGLASRSRAVREAMREYVERHATLADVDGEVVALLGFDYRHDEVIEELHAVQHDHQDVVESTSHTHQGEWCLEALFCRGDADRVAALADRLRDFDGVHRVKTMVIAEG